MLAFVLSAAISGTSFFILPQQWEAIAYIQVGHILIPAADSHALIIPVESPVNTVDEMMTPAFVKSAAKTAGLPSETINLIPMEYGGHGRLDITDTKDNVILLRLRADSRANAKKLAQAFVDKIRNQQMKIITPFIINKTRMLDVMRHDLETIQEASTDLRNKPELIDQVRHEAGLPAAVYWRLSAIQRSVDLQSKIASTKQRLSFPFLVKTHTLSGVNMLPRPAFPRPSVFVGLGILLWLMMSVAITIWRKKT